MDNRDFNQMVKSWPTVTKVVGHMADGTPLTVEVHSWSAPAPEENQ